MAMARKLLEGVFLDGITLKKFPVTEEPISLGKLVGFNVLFQW
jgi:hypothetical protein